MRLGPPCDGVFRAMLELEAGRTLLRDEFLKRVFDAAQRIRLHVELETTAHWQCEIHIGECLVRIVRSTEGAPPAPLLGHLIVHDSDAMFARAVEAGASAVMPGVEARGSAREQKNEVSRDKHLIDPFGNAWIVMARTETRAPRAHRAR